MRARHLFLLLLWVCPASLLSQGTSEDDLYFPPEISVGVAQDAFTELRLIHRLFQEEVRDKQNFTDHLIGTRRIWTRTEPLLPIVYFDPASYVIPESYRRLTGERVLEFREGAAIYGNYEYPPATRHDDVLNIIGSRMRNNPAYRIGLRGSWSNEPGDDESVARERTEVVAEYLQNVWGIEPGRITRLEPECPVDSNDHVLRLQEARSVRIVPNRGELLAPVTYESISTSWRDALSLKLRVIPHTPVTDVRSARLRFILDDEIVQEVDLSHPEIFDDHSITWYVGWYLPERIDPSVSRLDVQVLVENVNGRIRVSEVHAIPIRWEEERRSGPSDTGLQYEYLVAPFEAGDSILSREEDRALVEWLGAVAPELEAIRDRIEWIEVIGSGDITEVDGIDPVKLATALAIREAQLELRHQVKSAPNLPVVYSVDVPRRADGFPDMDQLYERAERSRLGDTYEALVENNSLGGQIEGLVYQYSRDRNLISDLSALASARAAHVADYLCLALDTTGVPVKVMEDVTDRTYRSRGLDNSVMWNSVDRAERRSVRIRFILSENVAPEARREG